MLVVVALLSALVPADAGREDARAAAPQDRTVTTAGLPEQAADARARFLQGDFAVAVALADAVDAAFLKGPAWTADDDAWAAWTDSRVTRALALKRLGRDADAEETLKALAVVRPTYSPDKSFVPPKVETRFEELREALLSGPTVPLTIVLQGSGTVCIDGRVVQPGTLDVLPGTHYLGVTADGKSRGEAVFVDGAKRVVLRGSADAGPGPAAPPGAGTANDGPPWLWIGVGAGLAVAAASAIVVVAVVTNQAEPVPNPGGVTVAVDASALDEP